MCGILYLLYHYYLIEENSTSSNEFKEANLVSYPLPTFIYLFAISLTGPSVFPYLRNYALRAFAKKVSKGHLNKIMIIFLRKTKAPVPATSNKKEEDKLSGKLFQESCLIRP